jgi:predicted CXXCH cytochrome family protein
VVRVATICDHVEPHAGDWNMFLTGKLQSLCFECHNSEKRLIERRGYSKAIGEDGWPSDPAHPANRPASS